MLDALTAAFAGTGWPLAFLAYFLVGLVVGGRAGGGRSRFMSALGWPLELIQRLAGTTGLPYLFLVPNLLVFGLFTFAPLFINIGFSATEGQSILFEQRDFAGTENFTRLLGEVNPPAPKTARMTSFSPRSRTPLFS